VIKHVGTVVNVNEVTSVLSNYEISG